MNEHDSVLFAESLELVLNIADEFAFDLTNTAITLDAGFDSQGNQTRIEWNNLRAVIKPNLRRTKKQGIINTKLHTFELNQHLYQQRFKVERTFAWKHTYRKLVIRYEKLQSTFLGFRYLAYSMINFRSLFERM